MEVMKYNSELDGMLPVLVKETALECKDSFIESPEKVDAFARNILRMNKKTEEYIYMFACTIKAEIIGVFEIGHGSVESGYIQPREMLLKALLVGAASIILVHNHPSQITHPSACDLKVTKRIKEACDLVGISLLDHIIVGNEFYSLRENGYLAG